jgi:hypothetical protein
MGKRRNVQETLGGKTEGKRKLGRLKCKIEDDIEKDFKEMGCENVDCIQLVQDRVQCRDLVNSATNLLISCLSDRHCLSLTGSTVPFQV